MFKKIILLVGFFISSVAAEDNSAYQQCIKKCNIAENESSEYCLEKIGDDRKRCEMSIAPDKSFCLKFCDQEKDGLDVGAEYLKMLMEELE